MTYADRIRAGAVAPWIRQETEAAGARASAAAVSDELDSLDRDDPRRDDLEQQRSAWLDRAAVLEERTR